MNIDFGRLITAMVTPFKTNGNIDFDVVSLLAKHLVDTGSDSIVVTGTTGESPTLSYEEDLLLYKTVLDAVKGRAKVIAGTGSNSTQTAIEHTKKAVNLGVDGVLQVCPYYNKPNQEGLYQHFKAISEECLVPIMLYNIPGRTGVNMLPETTAKLAKLANITSIKEAAGDLAQMEAIRQLTPESFRIYSGDDSMTLDFLKRGGYGVVSVAAHIIGKAMRELINAYVAGDISKSESIHHQYRALFKVLFITTNPIPVKAALNLVGINVGKPRLPLVPLSIEHEKELRKIMHEMGLC